MNDVRQRLQNIFREVFDDPGLELRDEMTAQDIDGWDSLAHINLIIAVESKLKVKFATAEISRLKEPGRMTEELAARRDEMLSQVAVFVAFLAFYAITAGSDSSPFNAHVRQAFALIHGHSYIDAPNYIEHAQIGAYSYQLHPILPALLLMPFAAIWGMDSNQAIFSIIVGALDVALAWRLLGRFRLTVNA